MSQYPVQTLETCPAESKPALEQLNKAFGTLPNIAGVIANSPKLIQSLVGVFQQVHTSSLSEAEIQTVLLTDAVVNSCAYAVAFHTALAKQQEVAQATLDSIRARQVPADSHLAAFYQLATNLIEKRGHLAEDDRSKFLSAGFTPQQILEVIAIVAASTITNYAGTICDPPLEAAYQPYAWQDPSTQH